MLEEMTVKLKPANYLLTKAKKINITIEMNL